MSTGFDFVIVGAGSAGCVLAARLAEAGAQVLLLEAGPDRVPASLADSTGGASIEPATDWGLTGTSGPDGRVLQLPRGRVIGGCSAVNATFALRGSPADYDAWAAAGNPGWGFADLLPAFVRLERDLDYANAAYHGTNGPTPVRRHRDGALSAFAAAGALALESCGLPPVVDHNAPGAVGVGPLPLNTVDGRRIDAATAYLDRSAPNPHVRGDAVVHRVLVSGGQARGVVLADGEVIEAGAVIVSAGAYHTPGILVRSGIGPAADVHALGLDLVADLPGVGNNLQDHVAFSVDLRYSAPAPAEPVFQLVGTLHSSAADRQRDAPDLQVLVGGPWPDRGCFIGTALLKPRSRGRVRVVSLDPYAAPAVDLGYFTDPADLPRLLEGAEIARAAAAHPAVLAIAGPAGAPALQPDDVVGRTWSYHHPVGTCAMGRDPAADAVVDHGCRVYGVDGLWVVDASVMPEIPSANTNLPTIAIAEHVAATICTASWRRAVRQTEVSGAPRSR